MRFVGLTLCLIASSFSARADSLEDRVVALEARVKSLEDALHSQGKPTGAVAVDGLYKAVLPNGDVVTATFDKGSVTAHTAGETKTGTYEIIGQNVVITADGKTEALVMEGGRLRSLGQDKLEFIRTK